MRIIHIIFAIVILSIPAFFFKKVLDTNQRLIETNSALLKQIQKLETDVPVCPQPTPVSTPQQSPDEVVNAVQ